MKHSSLGWTFVVMTTFVMACGGPEQTVDSQSAAPLLYGTPTTERPEVGKFFPAPNKLCTATLISSRTFVTAAHCIQYSPQALGGTFCTDVEGCDPALRIPIERTFSQGGQLGEDDIAFGRLTRAVSVVIPATIATSLPNPTWLTAIGYGCTDNRDENCTTAGSKTYYQYWYTGGASDVNSHGDSGGPTFIGMVGERGPMARIASGWATTWLGDSYDVGANAITYRSHIVAMDTALNNDGISYRSHVEGLSWVPATQNGAVSGTTGQSRRLEALQVWSPRPGVSVCYKGHVQNIGWQAEVCDGNVAGTYGQGLRMEAVTIRLAARPPGTNGVRYNAYLQGIGWQGWRQDGQVAGTTGQSRRIEAIMIQLY